MVLLRTSGAQKRLGLMSWLFGIRYGHTDSPSSDTSLDFLFFLVLFGVFEYDELVRLVFVVREGGEGGGGVLVLSSTGESVGGCEFDARNNEKAFRVCLIYCSGIFVRE